MARVLKKIITVFILISFFFSSVQPAFSFAGVPEFLCELGLKYYQLGDYAAALHEFKKALLINPDYEPAIRYIQTIEKETSPEKKGAIIQNFLDQFEKEKTFPISPLVQRPPVKSLIKAVSLSEKISPNIIFLDEKIKTTQPNTKFELELDESLIINGQGISRFLVIDPKVITVVRKTPDQVEITAKQIGSSYLHIWDKTGRWTFEIQVVPPKLKGETLEEIQRRKIEEAEYFKFRYSFDWGNFEIGKNIDTLKRTSLYFNQWLGLTGESPYGMFDIGAQFSKLGESSDLTNLSLGLSDGHWAKLRDFDLRLFDFTASFSGLVFPGESLRGVRFDSPLFDNKFNYTLLWAREGQGRFGPLAPGLEKTRDAFVEGGQIAWFPNKSTTYKFNLFKGYGDERFSEASSDVIGIDAKHNFKNFGLGYEVGYDHESIAYLVNSRFRFPRLNINTEFRNIAKNYLTLVGRPSRSGELGGLLITDYALTDKIRLSQRLDLYRDRLFPNPDDPSRYNINQDWQATVTVNPKMNTSLGYESSDQRGQLSPHMYERYNLGVYKTVDFIKQLSTYATYSYQKNKNILSPTSDYIADHLSLGLRFSLLGQLYYYLSKELNWVEEMETGVRSHPNATETGLDYSSQLFKSSLYGTWRLRYRDEEDTTSTHSFLSGEDSVETQGEISFKPYKDYEAFLSCRLRNIWPEDSSNDKRLEAEVRTGMRVAFNTGIKWNAVGDIQALVFKDQNQDGLRQTDEPFIDGIKLFLGKDKLGITDAKGQYLFKNIKGKKAYVDIDISSLPVGFVLTSPAIQEVPIVHNAKTKVWFGIVSRSEVYGIIFEDSNLNGKYDVGETTVSGVILTLEDGTKARTNDAGQYYLRKSKPGDHTLSIDINSIPLDYLPAVPITKKFTLFEGATFTYDVPLKRVK